MKKISVFFIFCSIVVFSAPIFSQTDQRYINSEHGLRLRDNPSNESNIISNIPFNDPVVLSGREGEPIQIDGINGKWIEVFWSDKSGWVFDGYLSKIPSSKKHAGINPKSPLYNRIMNEFKIAGISNGMSYADIVSVIGKPNSYQECQQDRFGNSQATIIYDGIGIMTYKDKVFQIVLNSKKFPTFRGIRVGDSVESLLKMYPGCKPGEYYSKETIYFYSWGITFYISDNIYGYYSLLFYYSHGHITSIGQLMNRSDEYGTD
jgi:hypothetical protein